jgi:hypothetical protein
MQIIASAKPWSNMARFCLVIGNLSLLYGCSFGFGIGDRGFGFGLGPAGLFRNSPYLGASGSNGFKPVSPIQVDLSQVNTSNAEILNALPNETIKISVGQVDAIGNVSFGPIGATQKNGSYVVVLDYIKFKVEKHIINATPIIPADLEDEYESEDKDGDKHRHIHRPIYYPEYDTDGSLIEWKASDKGEQPIRIQFYVGVGLRMTATVFVKEAGVDLSSLYGLGAAAEQKKISGSLLVETLGVTGPDISPLLPWPSEINVSSIQNAIQSIATVKAKMYEEKGVYIKPQIIQVDNQSVKLNDVLQQIDAMNYVLEVI